MERCDGHRGKECGQSLGSTLVSKHCTKCHRNFCVSHSTDGFTCPWCNGDLQYRSDSRLKRCSCKKRQVFGR